MSESLVCAKLPHPAQDRSAGSSALIDALVRHYDELVEHVRRHIARRGGDRSVAGDVVHDVCVQLSQTPPREAVHTPVAFLRHVASCRATDLHRIDIARRAWVECTAHLPESADDGVCGHDPARIVSGRQGLQALAAAIDALPARCRDVFVMHKVHEIPQAEVAQRLGISIKAVEKHLRLGVAACRRTLAAATS